MGSPANTLLNINNFSAWISDDGESAHNPFISRAGVIYPRGTANVIYQDGLVWGGYSRDGQEPSLRVGGQIYRAGTQPGRIISVGVAQDRSDSRVRIYRIRPGWLSLPTAVLRTDASELFCIDPSEVTQTQIDEVRAQYGRDWDEWPVDMGAPFYDLNGNGVYEPSLGETPGIAGADQVIWFVCNDLDIGRTTSLYGSPPIGLELQVTMWGYKRSDALGQVYFRRYRLINKSGALFDSVFVAQWSDSDIGKTGDDLAGCDTVLNMGYTYNGYPEDQEFQKFNLPPPAVGYDLLQGPVVPSPGNTAIFDFKERPGYKNLPMTSFSYILGDPSLGDAKPTPRDYAGTIEWYKMLRGYIPNNDDLADLRRYITGYGPDKGKPTLFPLSGNPVTGSGDLDGHGNNFSPGERRIVLSSGPFTMQPGDTQEVIISIVGGISEDYLMSAGQMMENDAFAQAAYNTLFSFLPTPLAFTAAADYINSSQTRIHFRAVNYEADSIHISIKRYDGVPVGSLRLYDDGAHGDGGAKDGLFCNDWLTTPFPQGLYVDARVSYSGGRTYSWPKIYENLATGGPLRITQFLPASDNLNHDGVANPGENIRYTLTVENQAAMAFSQVEITQARAMERQFVTDLSAPNGNEIIPEFPANSYFSWDYTADARFYQFNISTNFTGGDSIHLIFKLTDDQYNLWRDTVAVWVAALPVQPQEQLMSKVYGSCYGQLGCRLIDPSLLVDHTYQVSFNRQRIDGTALYDLQDLTAGTTLLTAQPYPDQYGHNSRVVNGIIITRGTTIPRDRASNWNWIPEDEIWLVGIDNALSWPWIGFRLGADFWGSTVPNGRYHSVKIVFDPEVQTNCAVYRSDLGYQYSGIGVFSGAAYDISDALNPRRVNIVFTEDDTLKPADMIWNPDKSKTGGEELLFIMNSDYDPVIAGGYDNDNFGPKSDVLWAARTRFYSYNDTFIVRPAELYLYVRQTVSTGDVFQFTPQWTNTDTLPHTFQLYQNYPNPFNLVTNIQFYLIRAAKVKLEIYNVLGQKVRTLMNGEMEAGEHRLQWDGSNNTGNTLGSGIYFFRISIGDFVKTRKMILLK